MVFALFAPFLLCNFTNFFNSWKWHCDKFTFIFQLHHFSKVEKVSRIFRFKKRGKWKRKEKIPFFLVFICKDKKRKSACLGTTRCLRLVGEKPFWTPDLGLLRLHFTLASSLSLYCYLLLLRSDQCTTGTQQGSSSPELEGGKKQLLISLQLALTQWANRVSGANQPFILCTYFHSAFISPTPSNVSIILLQYKINQVAWNHWWLEQIRNMHGVRNCWDAVKKAPYHLTAPFFAGCPSSIEMAAPTCLEVLTLHCLYVPGWLPDVPEGLQQEDLPDIPQIWDHSLTESTDVLCHGVNLCRAASLCLEIFPLHCCAAILPSEMLPAWGCHCDNFFIMQIGPLACLSFLSLSFSCLLYLCTGGSCRETLYTHQFNNPLEYGVDSACAALQICLWIN